MSPRLRLHFAVQTLALMVGVAGACVAVMVDALISAPSSVQPRLAADPTPPRSLCEQDRLTVDTLRPREREALLRSLRQAQGRCQDQLGEDAGACSLEAVMPLDQAVCLVEGQIGPGRIDHVQLHFDSERERMQWSLGDRHRAYRVSR